jgi:hypothetical protein
MQKLINLTLLRTTGTRAKTNNYHIQLATEHASTPPPPKGKYILLKFIGSNYIEYLIIWSCGSKIKQKNFIGLVENKCKGVSSSVQPKRRTKSTSQSNNSPWSSASWKIVSVGLCGLSVEQESNSLLQVQRCPITDPCFHICHTIGKVLNWSTITVWEGKLFQKCVWSIFGFTYIVQ